MQFSPSTVLKIHEKRRIYKTNIYALTKSKGHLITRFLVNQVFVIRPNFRLVESKSMDTKTRVRLKKKNDIYF